MPRLILNNPEYSNILKWIVFAELEQKDFRREPKGLIETYEEAYNKRLTNSALYEKLANITGQHGYTFLQREGSFKDSRYLVDYAGIIKFIFKSYLHSTKTSKLKIKYNDPKISCLLKEYFSSALLDSNLPGLWIFLREFVLGVGLAQSLDKFFNIKTKLEDFEDASNTFQLFLHSCGEYFIFSTAANILTAATLFKASEQQKASP